MKQVNIPLIIQCHNICLWCVIITMADYLVATIAVICSPEHWLWIPFASLGTLAALTGFIASRYPAYHERRTYRAMIESDNGSYVEPETSSL
jgi:hypothetical protein